MPVADETLEAINLFRIWHLETVQAVQHELSLFFHQRSGFEAESLPITSRLKTAPAMIAKLIRSETALDRMQDIAGARIVVPTLYAQDVTTSVVTENLFREQIIHIKDQREEPDQYGYRAVHAIARLDRRLVEIQVRTIWQDRWAQIVERLDAAVRPSDLKHGNGPAEWLEWLHALSDEFRKADLGEPYDIPPIPGEEEDAGEEGHE